MAKKIGLDQARALSMRGLVDRNQISKKPEPVIEQPKVNKQDEINQSLLTAINGISVLSAKLDEKDGAIMEALLKLPEKTPEKAIPTQQNKQPKSWVFKVTKRDRNGNIDEFTAKEV